MAASRVWPARAGPAAPAHAATARWHSLGFWRTISGGADPAGFVAREPEARPPRPGRRTAACSRRCAGSSHSTGCPSWRCERSSAEERRAWTPGQQNGSSKSLLIEIHPRAPADGSAAALCAPGSACRHAVTEWLRFGTVSTAERLIAARVLRVRDDANQLQRATPYFFTKRHSIRRIVRRYHVAKGRCPS